MPLININDNLAIGKNEAIQSSDVLENKTTDHSIAQDFKILYQNRSIDGPGGPWADSKKMSYDSRTNLIDIFVSRGIDSNLPFDELKWQLKISNNDEKSLQELFDNKDFFNSNNSYPSWMADQFTYYTLNLSLIEPDLTGHEVIWEDAYDSEIPIDIPTILWKIAEKLESFGKEIPALLITNDINDRYKSGQKINITIKNLSNETFVFNNSVSDIILKNMDTNNTIDSKITESLLATELKPGEAHTITWDQKDVNSTQVEPGIYYFSVLFSDSKEITQVKTYFEIRNPLLVSQDKYSYEIGEKINFTVKNIGINETLTFSDSLLGLVIMNLDKNQIINTDLFGTSEVIELEPNNSEFLTWDQKDVNSTQVEPGNYIAMISTAHFIEPVRSATIQFVINKPVEEGNDHDYKILNISNNDGISTSQQIISNDKGDLFAVWQDNSTGNYDIYFSQIKASNNTLNLKENINISNSSGMSSNPKIDFFGSNIYIIWKIIHLQMDLIYFLDQVLIMEIHLEI